MQHLKKVSLAAASVLAALVPAIGLAAGEHEATAATTQDTRLLLAIDERPTLRADGAVVMTGTVRCPAGNDFLLTVNLTQGTEFEGNFTGGLCTGDVQAWSATVGGGLFRRGDALARAFLQPADETFAEVETANTIRVGR